MDKWQWHRWFAWYPVVSCYTGKFHWLHFVERKLEWVAFPNMADSRVIWTYREVE